MKILKGFFIISLCLLLGRMLSKIIAFPIPEVVYGMLILLIGLISGLVKLEDVEDVGNGLLSVLAFLFLPLVVSLVRDYDKVNTQVVGVLIVVLLTSIITMAVTAKVVDFVQKRRTK